MDFAITDAAQFDAFMSEGPVQALLDDFAQALGTGPLTRPIRGSVLIGLAETEVLKVFPPHEAPHFTIELECLKSLSGKLPIPTPTVIDSGTRAGWGWIRMTRLAGRELTEAWPELSPEQRLSLGTQLGETLKVMHGLTAPASVPILDWSQWCAERLPLLAETQRAKGCPEPLLKNLQSYVQQSDLSPGVQSWLHTEVMREHLLVETDGPDARLSGLFDFEPSWVGPAHYEFASVGLFFSAGDSAVFQAVMRAAGQTIEPRRLLAFAALHRYANLGWYHSRLGGPMNLQGLADRWFS